MAQQSINLPLYRAFMMLLKTASPMVLAAVGRVMLEVAQEEGVSAADRRVCRMVAAAVDGTYRRETENRKAA